MCISTFSFLRHLIIISGMTAFVLCHGPKALNGRIIFIGFFKIHKKVAYNSPPYFPTE